MKREAKKGFEIIKRPDVTFRRKSYQWTYLILIKYFALVVEGCNCYTEPDIVLLIDCFEVFGGGTRLAMPKTICASDISSLKPGSGATEGVLD